MCYGAACRANHKRVEERAEIADQPGSRRCCPAAPVTMRLGRVVVAAALVGTCSGYQDGALKRIDVGYVMSWYGYRDRAASEGGRLPTTAELAAAGIDVGYDQWIAITSSPGPAPPLSSGPGGGCGCGAGPRLLSRLGAPMAIP